MILVPLPLAILLRLPGSIILDSTGIRQRFWQRRGKHVPWKDFASVVHVSEDGSTVVYGRFQSPITFSPYLVDQTRFDREVVAFSKACEIRDDL